jgi:S1-C subfamily serine protease
VSSGNASGAFLGVQTDPEARNCKITAIVKESPAEKAGLKEDDVIVAFDGKKIGPADDLFDVIRKKKPGDEVTVEVQRGDETKSIKVTLAKRGG